MTTGEALKIVQNYGSDWRLPGLLETMEQMYEENQRDGLNSIESKAFRIVWGELAELFRVT